MGRQSVLVKIKKNCLASIFVQKEDWRRSPTSVTTCLLVLRCQFAENSLRELQKLHIFKDRKEGRKKIEKKDHWLLVMTPTQIYDAYTMS